MDVELRHKAYTNQRNNSLFMTNFETLKEKIWKAAQKSDKKKFDLYCDKLMKKVHDNWWRIGWSIYPKNINELLKMIDKLAKEAHKMWIKAMKCGDAPNEDVSPGEGFALCSKLIREAIKEKSKK